MNQSQPSKFHHFIYGKYIKRWNFEVLFYHIFIILTSRTLLLAFSCGFYSILKFCFFIINYFTFNIDKIQLLTMDCSILGQINLYLPNIHHHEITNFKKRSQLLAPFLYKNQLEIKCENFLFNILTSGRSQHASLKL